MIQRIQTIYLMIITGLLALLFFADFAQLSEAGVTKIFFDVFGVQYASNPSEYLYPTYYMTALLIITILVTLITIFLYRRRWLQIRLCLVSGICQLGLQIYIGMYVYSMYTLTDIVGNYLFTFSVWSVIPIVCMIFTYLAFRGIVRDEALIKSLNRIR